MRILRQWSAVLLLALVWGHGAAGASELDDAQPMAGDSAVQEPGAAPPPVAAPRASTRTRPEARAVAVKPQAPAETPATQTAQALRIVLGLTGGRTIRSAFLDISLDIRDPHGLAVLACIVTSTPGTVWAGLTPNADTLTLHVLDLQDEALWIRTIKQRYEQLLMEIFE